MAVAVVLAAGRGRRLGGPKALLEVAGRPMVSRAVATSRRAAVEEVIVVTGCRAEEVEALARAASQEAAADLAEVRCVRNEDWERGRTGSLQAAWEAAGDTGALVVPVDLPAVRLVTLDLLLGVHGYAAAAPEVVVPVVDTSEGRRRGHPVLLARSLRDAVLAAGPDDPLRSLIRSRETLEVPVDDPGILLDVNTPEDLARAEALLAGA